MSNNKKALIFDIDCTLLDNGCTMNYKQIIDIIQFPKKGETVSKEDVLELINSGKLMLISTYLFFSRSQFTSRQFAEGWLDEGDMFEAGDNFIIPKQVVVGQIDPSGETTQEDVNVFCHFYLLMNDSSNGERIEKYYKTQIKKFKKFMEKILNPKYDDKVDFYIVTTRPLKDVPDEILENKSLWDDYIIDYEYNVILKQMNMLELLYTNIMMKISRTYNVTDGRAIFHLNSNPKTRWLYYLNMAELYDGEGEVEYINFCGRINEMCRYNAFREVARLNEDIVPELSLSGSNYGGYQSGVIKMLQIIDIVELGGYQWQNVYFFDDAKHNFEAWENLGGLSPQDLGKMNFIRGSNEAILDHQWVFAKKGIFDELDSIIR